MAHPWRGSRVRVLRINRSSVPWGKSNRPSAISFTFHFDKRVALVLSKGKTKAASAPGNVCGGHATGSTSREGNDSLYWKPPYTAQRFVDSVL